MTAWHFLRRARGGALQLRDGRTVAVGEWLQHDGALSICQSGLHASWRAVDALQYCEWEAGFVCLVEVDGIGEQHGDKFVCSRRKVLFAIECDELLRLFSRQAALSVLHLWDGEVPAVVREYLETGNEEIRDAAWAAARDAARAAAWDAARAAARAAARDAAWAAAWDAARDAAWDAAWAAARDAARDAAWDAKISDLNATLELLILGEAIAQGFQPEAVL